MKSIHFIVIITFFLSACGNKKQAEDKQPAAPKDSAGNVATLSDLQLKMAGVQTDSLQTKTLSAIVKVNGSIDVPPQNMVSVSVPLGGYLRSTHLLPGMRVQKGQPIAVMEDMQYIQLQQDYLTTKSQLSFDELEYQRQKELNKSKAVSDKIFQQAEA
ncbi:MAG: efflux transporter periplasmic adaptor subunit, partial [Bacteroidota bacterium]|nr:efflux transporter periplasmic adaptor subunit [Bacteroidota bacterium]